MQYYLADGNQQRGPFPLEQLLVQGLRPDTLVWREGMADWQRADSVPEVRALLGEIPASPPPIPPVSDAPAGARAYVVPPYAVVPYDPASVTTTRIAAGVCGIVLGYFGVHKFILGMVKPGLIMLLLTLGTCGGLAPVVGLIGIIEGIVYLTKSDQEFYQRYMVQKQGWF
ncbi:MAG: GYF domain-containing protein [Bacillota bacterium]